MRIVDFKAPSFIEIFLYIRVRAGDKSCVFAKRHKINFHLQISTCQLISPSTYSSFRCSILDNFRLAFIYNDCTNDQHFSTFAPLFITISKYLTKKMYNYSTDVKRTFAYLESVENIFHLNADWYISHYRTFDRLFSIEGTSFIGRTSDSFPLWAEPLKCHGLIPRSNLHLKREKKKKKRRVYYYNTESFWN